MVQFISHHTSIYSYLDSIAIALRGGCRWIQLRMKDADEQTLIQTAIKAQELCRQYGATFIIDDNPYIAKLSGADGVHLGKNDMPIAQARAILGSQAIIGGTANTIDDIISHAAAGANYIGCGPFRFTTTKQRLSPLLGIEGYKQIIRQMRERSIDLPIVAIGGITAQDIDPIMATGVTGIALSGSILRAAKPIEEMQKIIKIIEQWKNL